jgi:hypothetical protein
MIRRTQTSISVLSAIAAFVWVHFGGATIRLALVQSFSVVVGNPPIRGTPRRASGLSASTVETVNGGDAALFVGCTTRQYDNYDVVTVDLDDNRDYPIYIGTDFTNEQGKMIEVLLYKKHILPNGTDV